MRISVWLTVAVVAVMLGFLLYASWPFWWQYGLGMVFSGQWYPFEQLFGLLPALAGTVWAVALALLIAVPAGVAAAVLGAECVSGRWRDAMRLGMELLAGIPSVVYGLLGLWVLLPFLQSSLGLPTGHSLLAAGLLLAVMMLPTIMVLSQAALAGVAASQRQSAENLGMDWTARLRHVLLPQAWPGIRSAILLALGRAMGETIAVMLVIGSIDRLPEPWYHLTQPAQTITSRIGREIGEAAFGSMHWSALMACGALLAIITISLSLIARARPGYRDTA
ncbi:MAG: phosphate ABC transporter permease subunit PstC [Mariprofundaceae bacterium]